MSLPAHWNEHPPRTPRLGVFGHVWTSLFFFVAGVVVIVRGGAVMWCPVRVSRMVYAV